MRSKYVRCDAASGQYLNLSAKMGIRERGS